MEAEEKPEELLQRRDHIFDSDGSFIQSFLGHQHRPGNQDPGPV